MATKPKKTTKEAQPAAQSGLTSDKVSTERGLLTETKLDSVLNVTRGKAKVKSVSSPFAQTTIQCAAPYQDEWTAETLQAKYLHIKQYDEAVAAVFDLQFSAGSRISETLSILHSDIDALGKVTIRSAKGGVPRVVQSMFSAGFLIAAKADKRNPFAFIDRFYVYRAYVKFGLSRVYNNNQRASVTHMPRHEVAKASKKINRENELTKGQLGQKRVSNTAYYTGERDGKEPSK